MSQKCIICKTNKPEIEFIKKYERLNACENCRSIECIRCKRFFKSKRALSLHITKSKTPCDQEYKCFYCYFKTMNCNDMFWHSKICKFNPTIERITLES